MLDIQGHSLIGGKHYSNEAFFFIVNGALKWRIVSVLKGYKPNFASKNIHEIN